MPDIPNTCRIAIAGVTGYIGGRLAPQLLADGYTVRCLVRSAAKIAGRDWSDNPNVEVVESALNNPAALENCQVAYYLVHSMTSAAGRYADEDRSLATQFAEAAKTAGVQRIIYLGGLGETGPNLSEHLASRREVESALASTGIPVTVLRAAMIIGSGSASFEILRYLVERLPVMVTPKWVSTKCQPIAVRNVIGYLAGCLANPATTGQTYDIGGPEVLTYRQIMTIMAAELKLRPRLIIPLPFFTPKLSSYWIHLVTPLSNDIGKPLAEGLKNPVVCRENAIRTLIPQTLLTVQQAIAAALVKIAQHGVVTNWAMAGPIPGDPDWAGGTVFRDSRTITVNAPAGAAFRAVCRVGGGHGWYAADWLWQVRGWLDRLFGGPGLRRGRRDPERVGFGEALDFWRVTGITRDRRLALRAEMKLPGEAQLEFEITPIDETHCTLRQTALFQPRGLLGLAYWYSVVPLHHVVFRGMLHGIQREAENETP